MIAIFIYVTEYNLTPQSIETILKRYSRVIMGPGGARCLIAFDDFVSVSVRLRAYTGKRYVYVGICNQAKKIVFIM